MRYISVWRLHEEDLKTNQQQYSLELSWVTYVEENQYLRKAWPLKLFTWVINYNVKGCHPSREDQREGITNYVMKAEILIWNVHG